MNKSLKIKAAVILAVLLACVYLLIGIPKSKEEVIANWNKNIHLGLDLRGGSHLVLQVQVQDAFKAEAAQVADRLKEELTKQNINFTQIDNTEPPSLETAETVQVNIKGIPPEKAGTFRSIANDNFKAWILSPAGGNDYKMTMRPSDALELRRGTVESAIRT